MMKRLRLFCILLSLLYITFIISNAFAIEETSKKLPFNNLSFFLKRLFIKKEEKIETSSTTIESSKLWQIKKRKIFSDINPQKLQDILNSSNCIKQLPKDSVIKLSIFDKGINKSEEYFLSYNGRIGEYTYQKFDLFIGLNHKDVLAMENSSNIDVDIKKKLNSKDIIFEYKNIFKALKYRDVLSCINEISIEEKFEEINQTLSNITKEGVNLINITNETSIKIENITIAVDVFHKQNLVSLKFKLFFEDVQNNIPYIIIAKNLSDYNNLRAIRILTDWSSAFYSVDYNSINWSEHISKQDLILIGYGCSNSVTTLIINETECKNLITNKKGIIEFYDYDSKNILVIIGSEGQNLVDTIYILVNNYLFEFNDMDIVLTNESMYDLALAPTRLKYIFEELQSVYKKAEEYEDLMSDRKLLYFVPFHPGKWFRAVHEDIDANRYTLSKDEKEILARYNFGELAKIGDDVIEQRNLVKGEIDLLKSNINQVLYIKIDKNIINLQTLENYNKRLEKANKDFEKLTMDYNKLNDLVWKIKMPAIEIRRLTNQ